MTFFQSDPQLQQSLDQILATTWAEFPTLAPNQIAVTWLVYDTPVIVNTGGTLSPDDFWQHPVRGAAYRGVECSPPAQIAQLFYLVALQEWLDQGMIPTSTELERALKDMVVDGNYDATSLVLDALTGTTSGPELPPGPMQTWEHQRNLVNRYFQSLQWPELATINVNQKLWWNRAYGRERLFLGELLENQNLLTTNATARLLHSIVGGVAVSAGRSQTMMNVLQRPVGNEAASLKSAPNSLQGLSLVQAGSAFGQTLPPGTKLWSKVGWTDRVHHEAAYIEPPAGPPYLLVVFTNGEKNGAELLPFIAQQVQAAIQAEINAP